MLWVALELPALPLQLAERGGALAAPLAIAEGPAQRPVVACANAAARAAGVREGQAVAAAKALAGELRVLPRDAPAEREALERLAGWAGQFTPMVSVEPRGLVLEVGASLRLFGGHGRIAGAIREGVRALGFHAHLGIAPTPLAAALLARARSQGLPARACLEPARLRERLADLPLFLLEWPGESLARLADLGVLRLRDLLALPASGIARRFGPAAAAALDRLLGAAPDPRVPYQPPPRLRTRLELPAEAEGVEALVFPLKRMLAEMEGGLRARGAGVQRLVLVLEHARKARTRVDFAFAEPEREPPFILALAREKLARLALAAPTVALELRADVLLPHAPRAGTWLPGEREQALDAERLVERLAARLGRERVFAIALGDDHRPERDWKIGDSQGFPRERAASRRVENGVCPRFSPRPAWLLARPQRLVTEAGRPRLQGALALRAGPERIEAGWWDGHEVRRDYYVAGNARGETYWIFRDHLDPGAWYLHGVFA